MITNQSLTNPIGTTQQSTTIPRRSLLSGGLLGLLSSGRAFAQGAHVPPGDPFILLLKGIYKPVAAGSVSNLGLTKVHPGDGSYSKTLIYPVYGMPESREQGHAIGTFYVGMGRCAYDLPGGAMAMQFTGGSFSMIIPDGHGGQYDEGTFELTVLEATGVYSAFTGGHNHMVDRLHQFVAGPAFSNFPLSGYDEFCFCNVTTYPFP